MLKLPDLEKERSERRLSSDEFLAHYNSDLPANFPRATLSLLDEFKKENPSFFKGKSSWSLGDHRKKFMDWLPQYIRAQEHSR